MPGGRPRKSIIQKKRQGTLAPSREAVIHKLKTGIDWKPFSAMDIQLTENQMKYFQEICAIFESMEIMKPAFIPSVTNGAVMWDIIVRSKLELDEDGTVQHFDNGTSNTSGAMNAYSRAIKQWSDWANSMGLDMKSYGSLGIVESDKDPDEAKFFGTK